MSTSVINGQTDWNMSRDSEGYREYKITFRVRGASTDGPATVLQTPGLPLIGSYWNFDGDIDIWAWCRPDAQVKPQITGEPNASWTVEFTFSNKPLPRNSAQRCADQTVSNPLLEPQKISGSFVKYTKEAAFDRWGLPILNSSWEMLKGGQVEFDANRPQIKIEQNVAVLNLALVASMVDTVNTSTMWGTPPRTIKLSDFQWDRKVYGTCGYYYTRSLTFDIDFLTFDRYILDEGSKCLNGKNVNGAWQLMAVDGIGTAPNRWNPLNFIRYKDANGENARCILNGAGLPLFTTSTSTKTPIELVWTPGFGGEINVNFATAHGLRQGQTITISGVTTVTGYNGTYKIRRNPSTTGFIVDQPVNPGVWSSPMGGVVTTLNYGESAPGKIFVEKYAESNFFILGIPTVF